MSSSDRIVVPDGARNAVRRPGPRKRFRFESAASSHVGVVRDHNEDYAFAGGTLIAVADGVGGNVFGEVASEVAIQAIAYLDDVAYLKNPEAELGDAAFKANDRIADAIGSDEALDGMATTLTALHLDGPSLMTLHIGDSRAYGLRPDGLVQLTRDDSLVRELVDAGAITVEQARRHPARSVVLQALNGGPVQPHVRAHEVAADERYLVCSDGLSDYVEEDQIARILAEVENRAACCAALTEAALDVGAPDNVTCIVADVRPLVG